MTPDLPLEKMVVVAPLPGTHIPTGVGTLVPMFPRLPKMVEKMDVPEVPPWEKGLAIIGAVAPIEPPATTPPMPTQPKSCVAWLPAAPRMFPACPMKPKPVVW
jgi:hypothetical protein